MNTNTTKADFPQRSLTEITATEWELFKRMEAVGLEAIEGLHHEGYLSTGAKALMETLPEFKAARKRSPIGEAETQ